MTDIAVPVDTAVPVESVTVTTASPATVNAPPKGARYAAIVRSATLRATRTFAQAFIAVLTAGPVLHLNVGVVKAGATAGFAATLALVQRWLDSTSIPTIPAG